MRRHHYLWQGKTQEDRTRRSRITDVLQKISPATNKHNIASPMFSDVSLECALIGSGLCEYAFEVGTPPTSKSVPERTVVSKLNKNVPPRDQAYLD